MTLDEIRALSDSELNAEIHCALYGKPSPLFFRANAPEIDASKWSDTIAVYITSDTAFSSDLNAIHRAATLLSMDQKVNFQSIVYRMMTKQHLAPAGMLSMPIIILADARTMAEALLLTLLRPAS